MRKVAAAVLMVAAAAFAEVYPNSFFILLVLAWLIQYMIRFMMKKRSREFATYLLLGCLLYTSRCV